MAVHPLSAAVLDKVCEDLVRLTEKSFGPNALSVMLSTSSGKLLVTSRGAPIMKAVQPAHPIGRMIVDAVAAHERQTGDDSKTFLFLLHAVLRSASVSRDRLLGRGFAKLRCTVLPSVVAAVGIGAKVTCCVPSAGDDILSVCRAVVHTALSGQFNRATVDHLADVLCRLFADVPVGDVAETVDALVDDFDTVCLEEAGDATLTTKVVEGVIVERDFTVFDRDALAAGVRMVLIECDFPERDGEQRGDAIRVKGAEQLHATLTWHTSRSEAIVGQLRAMGVNLVLSSGAVAPILASHCRAAAISVVQMIPDDALRRLSRLSGVALTHRWCDLAAAAVTHASECRPFVLSGRRCVHLRGIVAPRSTCAQVQLIACANIAPAAKEVSSSLLAALKCVRTLFTDVLPSACPRAGHRHAVSVRGGGAFELAAHDALARWCNTETDPAVKAACLALKDALVSVPLRLLRNSYATDVRRLSHARLVAPYGGGSRTGGGIDARTGTGWLADGSDVLQPFAGKVALLYHLTALLEQLLRLDMVLAGHSTTKQ